MTQCRTPGGPMSFRLGVDVGGTFTDVLLVNADSGETWRTKTASTPQDQSIGVLRGIGKVCQDAGIAQTEIAQVLHGTTVGTNAILEGKGAVVGLVTTQGFRQVLHIARSFVPVGLAGWIIWPKPEPLASLEDTVEAIERIASDGSVVTALDDDDIRAKLRALRAAGVEALTISLINSYANATHEQRIAAIAAEELPDVPLSVSSVVLPELREYERTITAVANSYVHPQVSRYIASLAGKLDDGGVSAGLYILRSDGGLASAANAADSPVSMLLSGPAGGVAGAAWAAEQAGYRDFLTFDMGGTSTDVALVQDLLPRIGRETTVGDLKVRATSVDVRTVGAGGGSIAHVPPLTRALRVGPQSAGGRARPGRVPDGRYRADRDRRQRGARLPADRTGRRRDHARRAGRPRRGQDHRRRDGAGQRGGGRGGHRRHRQREHVRRAAPGVRAAGIRPPRLRTGRLRRRGPAARQRIGQADRRVAGDRPAVAGRAVRLRRRHHDGQGRCGPHLHPDVRRDQRRRAARPAARAGRGRRGHGRGPGGAPLRAGHHLPRGPALPRAGLRDHRAGRGRGVRRPRRRASRAGGRVRRRAPPPLLVPARGQRARAGQRARHRHRPAPRRRHGPAARRRPRSLGRAGP